MEALLKIKFSTVPSIRKLATSDWSIAMKEINMISAEVWRNVDGFLVCKLWLYD